MTFLYLKKKIISFQEMNTTDTEIELDRLEPGALYRIVVVARGIHGSSLPSSMLLINTSNSGNMIIESFMFI